MISKHWLAGGVVLALGSLVVANLAESEPSRGRGGRFSTLHPYRIMRDSNIQAEDILTARLALLALRENVSMSGDAHALRYILLPEQQLTTAEEAERVLSRASKPLFCTGVAVPGALVVNCQHARDPVGLEATRVVTSQSREFVIREIEILGGTASETQVISVRGEREELSLPLSVFLRWLQDYPVGDLQYSVALEQRAGSQHSVVMHLGKAAPGQREKRSLGDSIGSP